MAADTTITMDEYLAGLAEEGSVAADDFFIFIDQTDGLQKKIEQQNTALNDANAIHDNESGEIHAITEKSTPVAADEIIIEDSAASWIKKRISLTSLLGGGGGGGANDPIFIAGSFKPVLSIQFADYEELTGAGDYLGVHTFDPSTNEAIGNCCRVPSDIDTAGNVTVKLWGFTKGASPSGNVLFQIAYQAKGDNESPLAAFTATQDSAATAVKSTQYYLNAPISWTFAASSLAANDLFQFYIQRRASSGSDTSPDDYSVALVEIVFPRT